MFSNGVNIGGGGAFGGGGTASLATEKVFNVKAYGAKGNTKSITAFIANGSTTVMAYSAIFSLSDVGKTISVPTGAAGNDELVALIVGYISPTQVTINTPTSSALATNAVFGVNNDQVKGRIVAGSLNTFTALSAAFVVGDVGKPITIQYVGNASGTASLTTTIASYISPTQVTLTVAATIPTSVIIFFGTDDTAAIQRAINAAFAGGGNVYFPNGNYCIAGNLVTSDINGLNPNAQLYVPASASTSTNISPRQIKFIGESYSQAPYERDGINNFGSKLIALKSKGTGTLPSVIGGIGTAANNPIANWNATTTYWQHLNLIMSCNNGFGSNMVGLNGLNYTSMNGDNFHVFSTFELYSLHYANPLGTGFTGLVIGKRDNNVANNWSNCVVGGGFEYGIVLGEHIYTYGSITTGSCYYGFTFLDCNFLVSGTFNGAFNRHDLYFPDVVTPFQSGAGTAFVDINLENESSGINTASNWIFTAGNSILKDVSNFGRGTIKFNRQNGAETFTKIGGDYLYLPNFVEEYQSLRGSYAQGLTAHFDFNEGSGDFFSMGTFGYTSSLTPSGSINRVAGILGNAVRFPSGVNFLEGSNNNSLSAGDKEFSVDFWVRRDAATATNANVVSKTGTAGNREWAFYFQFDLITLVTSKDGTNYTNEVKTPAVITNGLWHHIAATWDGSKLYMYTDGILVDVTPVNSIFNSGAANLTVSKDLFAAGGNFVGTIDALSIRKKHLTGNEVAYLYNVGLGRERPTLVNETITAWEAPRKFISNAIGLSGANFGEAGQGMVSRGINLAPEWQVVRNLFLQNDSPSFGGAFNVDYNPFAILTGGVLPNTASASIEVLVTVRDLVTNDCCTVKLAATFRRLASVYTQRGATATVIAKYGDAALTALTYALQLSAVPDPIFRISGPSYANAFRICYTTRMVINQ